MEVTWREKGEQGVISMDRRCCVDFSVFEDGGVANGHLNTVVCATVFDLHNMHTKAKLVVSY